MTSLRISQMPSTIRHRSCCNAVRIRRRDLISTYPHRETWPRWWRKRPTWTVACTTWATRRCHGFGTGTSICSPLAGRRSAMISASRACTIRSWRTGRCRCGIRRRRTRARTNVRCQRHRPSASWCTCPSWSRSRQSSVGRTCTSTPGPLSIWHA